MTPSIIDRPEADPRVTVRAALPPRPGGRVVVYWMQRSQRAVDNPALDAAIDAANALGLPVVVYLAIWPYFPRGNLRHYRFLVDAIPELAEACARRGAGFVSRPFPDHHLDRFCDEVRAALVIGDENPLRETERWRVRAGEKLAALGVPLWTVDADVIVPTKLFPAEQYAAYTLRPRIHRVLSEHLVAGSEPRARHAFTLPRGLLRRDPADTGFLDALPIDRSLGPVDPAYGLRPGTKAALAHLRAFIAGGLAGYATRRNHPEVHGTSRLSPYLHFGHLGPRQLALAVAGADAPPEDRDGFLEELIVRRELAWNFVRRNPRYDSLDGCERWARATLDKHLADPRPHLYSIEDLAAARTADPLWNAAQRQMNVHGWMHGYVRMYWAKKILEWSPSPAEAMARAIHLNDRLLLDGREPAGYANIAWAIGGKHDRAWGERPIFGTVRFMSYASTSKKFDSRAYAAQQEPRLI